MLSALDEEVHVYVAGVLADGEEGVLADVLELLAAHGIEDTQALRDELHALRLQSSLQSQGAALQGAPPPSSTQATDSHQRGKDYGPSSAVVGRHLAAPGPEARPGKDAIRVPADAGPTDTQLTPPEALLCEMMPNVSREACCYALRKAKGDTDAALDFLLSADLCSLQTELDTMARRAERAARVESKLERQRVLGRYAEERDYAADGLDAPKLAPPRLPYTQSRKEAIKAPSILYRDGEPVHVKGNPRFESKWENKEEWDGGSTGRVKTKGRRGPGWV